MGDVMTIENDENTDFKIAIRLLAGCAGGLIFFGFMTFGTIILEAIIGIGG